MIFPNAHIRVFRQDAVHIADIRVQINFYAGDAASGGRRGEHEGNMLVRAGTDIEEGDIIQITGWPPRNVLPPLTIYTCGLAAELGQPGRHRIIPIYGGRRQG